MRTIALACLTGLFALAPVLVRAEDPIAPADACKPGEAVREDRYVKIGGIEQWAALKGDDCRNPVLLISWLQFVGITGRGMVADLDLQRSATAFKMPVFLFHGAEDLVTVPEVARRWFDSLSAPRKEFVLLPRTGHDHNRIMLSAQLALLRAQVAPLAD